MFDLITVPCIIMWNFHITDQEVEICWGDRTAQDKD